MVPWTGRRHALTDAVTSTALWRILGFADSVASPLAPTLLGCMQGVAVTVARCTVQTSGILAASLELERPQQPGPHNSIMQCYNCCNRGLFDAPAAAGAAPDRPASQGCLEAPRYC
jgi:hypothetical protein